ncbi:MAG TPA: hypothetical protein VG890_13015 [Puia sp.]|nr:hypothetical protein [Puia sp.]
MKQWLLAGAVGLMFALTACSAEVVATRPADVVYTRPPAPGPDYVWISGDWIWMNGSYRWHEGHWDHRRSGTVWHNGYWESHKQGYRWHKGHW